jgi:hypothetical protein
VPGAVAGLVPVHDAVEADRGVAEAGQGADDQQVGGGQGLGVEQVLQEGNVEPGELEGQRGGDGGGQGGVGQGARADS